MARLKEVYKTEIAPALKEQFGYTNVHQIPRIKKITLNMGVGEASQDKKLIDNAVSDLALITGQKPIITKARKSIAGFKLREDVPVGCKVTLREQRMFEFLDRLVNIALPRVRDFRGLSNKSFDKNGNYSLGLKEQIVFPEVDYDKTDKVRGMDITIVTTAQTKEEAKALLAGFNLPFRK